MKPRLWAALLLLLAPGCGDDTNVADSDAGSGKDAAPALDTASPDTTPENVVLIDDFEDGDGNATLLIGEAMGGYYSYDDKSNGGGSSIGYTGAEPGKAAMNGPGYGGSMKSMEVTATFDQGTLTYQAYVGWGLSYGPVTKPVDISAYKGVGYTYKGASHMVRIETTAVADYDEFLYTVPASTDWKTVRLPFTDFAQEGWGKKATLDLTAIKNISWAMRGSTGQKSTVAIDNLVFLSETGPKTPDMTVNPATPPTPGVIDSVAVTNPLQAKAEKYLTKGYNITNWLEQVAFTGFTYDESFVAKLAAAGFKALRLPIDLDRYATATGTGDAMTVAMDPAIFTVLDAFDAWTAKYGMSLTIDYHQYDYSLDMTKPDTLTKGVLAWSQVAAHFAASPREDLFYELLNEPDLSFAQNAIPTQAQWTTLAQRMIDAIRAVDTTHTILFGDTSWYAIGTLKSRKPFADTNIIYAFHFYEPFVFTHQGAGWSNMGSTHDIPYPYTPERWSQYYSDLGFNPNMPAWILTAAKGYYTSGNKSWVRNQILEAKKWAVTNNVAVICNEFGVNDTTSRMEDRARYYTDLIDIFAELQIPWQAWFMLMDKTTGVVAPEYRVAFKLD